jgi:hypothetical protein
MGPLAGTLGCLDGSVVNFFGQEYMVSLKNLRGTSRRATTVRPRSAPTVRRSRRAATQRGPVSTCCYFPE